MAQSSGNVRVWLSTGFFRTWHLSLNVCECVCVQLSESAGRWGAQCQAYPSLPRASCMNCPSPTRNQRGRTHTRAQENITVVMQTLTYPSTKQAQCLLSMYESRCRALDIVIIRPRQNLDVFCIFCLWNGVTYFT